MTRLQIFSFIFVGELATPWGAFNTKNPGMLECLGWVGLYS